MQFRVLFTTVALVTAANAATVTFFTGAGCTGSVVGSLSAGSGECVFITNGGSGRSVSFSDVPHQIQFFESGGAHDECTNGFQATASGSGCSTAPAG